VVTLNREKLIIELGWTELVIRTRRRCFQVTFAAVAGRTHDGRLYSFVQFGDHTKWLRRY
jgi:hypothetical protein